MKKRTDRKLRIDEIKTKQLMKKPCCLGFMLFGKNLFGVNMRNVTVLIDKPFYVGFSILDLSTVNM